jgi:hypothetical protein
MDPLAVRRKFLANFSKFIISYSWVSSLSYGGLVEEAIKGLSIAEPYDNKTLI